MHVFRKDLGHRAFQRSPICLLHWLAFFLTCSSRLWVNSQLLYSTEVADTHLEIYVQL
jgi:hypothetical protein